MHFGKVAKRRDIQRASPNPATARCFLPIRIRSAYIVVVLAACLFGRLVFFFRFILLFFAKRLPNMLPNLVKIMRKSPWKSLGSSMESPWGPKCIQVRKKHWIGLSPPAGDHFWNIFKTNIGKNNCFVQFLRLPTWVLFHRCLLSFVCVFWGVARVWGKPWKQWFCNTFHVK